MKAKNKKKTIHCKHLFITRKKIFLLMVNTFLNFINLKEHSEKNVIVSTYKRPPSKLDKYIDLILKNQRNVDEFVYLIKGNDDDPYDLVVTNYAKTRGE